MRRLTIFGLSQSLLSLACGLFPPASNLDPQPATATGMASAPATFSLALDYLYTGQPDRARTEFASRYSSRIRMQNGSKSCKLFRAARCIRLNPDFRGLKDFGSFS